LDERLESDATGARSDGDNSSLGGDTDGGVAIGEDGLIVGGAARSGMAPTGGGGTGLGIDRGGADWAPTHVTADKLSITLRTIGNDLTAWSPASLETPAFRDSCVQNVYAATLMRH
jgi:hypothetical protein